MIRTARQLKALIRNLTKVKSADAHNVCDEVESSPIMEDLLTVLGKWYIMLEPRELKVPDSISANTLKEMDKAVSNFKLGKVSKPVDLSDFK